MEHLFLMIVNNILLPSLHLEGLSHNLYRISMVIKVQDFYGNSERYGIYPFKRYCASWYYSFRREFDCKDLRFWAFKTKRLIFIQISMGFLVESSFIEPQKRSHKHLSFSVYGVSISFMFLFLLCYLYSKE